LLILYSHYFKNWICAGYCIK